MEMLLAHYFDLMTRRVKLMMLDWALKNPDDFIDRILVKPHLKELEYRLQLEEVLHFEVIFTVMQLCEDLAYVLETCKYTSPDPIASFKTIPKAPRVFRQS